MNFATDFDGVERLVPLLLYLGVETHPLIVFKYRTSRQLEGKVFYVAPDRTVDRATNQAYYVALVEADAASLAQAGEVKLQAGMPAEVFIKGEERTPLQYLVEPVTQVLRRAGQER